mmetsp:Transcript_36505/g.88478  ORF Transcript_36505/g.88478 Transcript_36505/m.88478 type:complete len:84 (+) Transcript_36505:183-434(+)
MTNWFDLIRLFIHLPPPTYASSSELLMPLLLSSIGVRLSGVWTEKNPWVMIMSKLLENKLFQDSIDTGIFDATTPSMFYDHSE